MDNMKIEEIYNETFSGLTLFYRDTNLSEKLISNYKVGQIIMERGFTDMTYIGGGLSSNFRYLIASSSGKDLSAFNPDSAKTGHILLSSNAYFKILDIKKIENKTQIFLLNIPEKSIEFFKSATSNIEEDITEKARQSFIDKINSDLIPELQSEDWKERTKFPIGMNDNGEMFFDDSKIVTKDIIKTEAVKTETVKIKEENNNQNKDEKPWWKIW
jgi:hypothetical protein